MIRVSTLYAFTFLLWSFCCPHSLLAQDVVPADIFLTPNGNASSVGGFAGGDGRVGAANDWVDWSIANTRPGDDVTDDMVFSTNIGDFTNASDWFERMRITRAGNVGIGLSNPGQQLHIGDGNVLIEGGGETALLFKRDFEVIGGPSGISTNPIFQFGRIIQAGDGDPEFRILYSDDTSPERSVIEFDRKGILASVRQDRGSHFEGFACVRSGTCAGDNPNDAQPVFRLNSSPLMQLEFGPGDNGLTDVAVRRVGSATLGFFTGDVTQAGVDERMRVDADGRVGIGRVPAHPLHMGSGAHVTIGGVWTNASSRTLKTGIEALGQSQAIQALEALEPVTFAYKATPSETHVGFIAEDVPDLVATGDRQGVAAMDIVAVLTRVVQQQQERIAILEAAVRILASDEIRSQPQPSSEGGR